MDYTPQHTQPFTLKEAINLDVSVIMEEITRLENSLRKLQETQEFLQSYLEATFDAEMAHVLDENKVVIESQEERITILKMALTEKGVFSVSHYEMVLPSINPSESASHTITSSEPPHHVEIEETEAGDRGVYL